MQISLREDYVEASDEAQFIEWMTDAAMQKWPCIDEGKNRIDETTHNACCRPSKAFNDFWFEMIGTPTERKNYKLC